MGRISFIIADIILINVAFLLATLLRHKGHFLPLPIDKVIGIHLISTIIWLVSFYLCGLYSYAKYSFFYIFSAIILGWVGIIVTIFFVRQYIFSRMVIIYSLPLIFIIIGGWRGSMIKIQQLRQYKKKGKIRTLIVGTGSNAQIIIDALQKSPKSNHEIVGLIGKKIEDRDIYGLPVLGTENDIFVIIKEKRIEEVILALPSLDRKIWNLISRCNELDIRIKAVLDLYNRMVGKVKINYVDGIPLLEIYQSAFPSSYQFIKRAIDVIVSLGGLLLFSPVILIISILIKLTSPGSIFYLQKRVGLDGKHFTLYKFRSMVVDAEKDFGPVMSPKEKDERATGIGRILRKLSLDEIPQLWNILKGEMSIVGPRPLITEEVKEHRELQGKRLNIKPGITGLAQINGRYNFTPRQKAKYDYLYIKSQSFILDLKILFKTIWLNLTGQWR